MIQRLVVLTLLSALLAAPAYADARGDAKKQVEFGIPVAQRGLWREAIYRWERATQIDPTYAARLQQPGASPTSRRASWTRPARPTRRRSQLEPNNALIKQNFDLFKEINDRTGRTRRSLAWSCRGRTRRLQASYFEIPIETPIQPKLDVRPFSRVYVAGFVAGGTRKSTATSRRCGCCAASCATRARCGSSTPTRSTWPTSPAPTPDPASNGAAGSPPPQPQPAAAAADAHRRDAVRGRTRRSSPTREYWKKIGEEHQQPLIVTGTVLFRPQSRSGFVQREQEIFDSFGRRVVQPERTYMERKGFILRPTFVFIDGRTGETLHSETFREEILYNSNQSTPALSSLLRADGPAAAELPEHAERAEDPRDSGAAQVTRRLAGSGAREPRERGRLAGRTLAMPGLPLALGSRT